MLSNLSGISPVYRRYPNKKGMARLRVSQDAKESVWRSVSGRNLMISQRSSRGNSGENFDGDIVVDGQGKDDNTMEASEGLPSEDSETPTPSRPTLTILRGPVMTPSIFSVATYFR